MPQAWVKLQIEFVTIHAPVSTDLEARSYVGYFRQSLVPFPSYAVGKGMTLPIPAGTGSISPGSHWWDIKFNFNGAGQVVSIDYTLVVTRVVDVVTAPNFDPGPLQGGEISMVIPSHNGPFHFTSPSFYWIQGVADIADWDGNGYDDYGEHDYGPISVPIPDPPLADLGPEPLPEDEAVLRAFLERLRASIEGVGSIAEVADAWAEYVAASRLADPTRIFQKLAKILDPVGVVLDYSDAIGNIREASQTPGGDGMRQAFIEFSVLAERYSYMIVAGGAASFVVTPVGGVVAGLGAGALYDRYYEASRRAGFGEVYDNAFGGSAPNAHNALVAVDAAAALPPSAEHPAWFDALYYLAAYPDAAAAVRNGSAASALAHYLAVGFAGGYQPSAGTSPLSPGDISLYQPGGPAAGPRNDVFVVPLQGMAGDGQTAAEALFFAQLGAIGGAVSISRTLTAIANRMAIDGFANYRDGVSLKQFPGRAETNFTTSFGSQVPDYFPGLDFSGVKAFMVVGPWTNGAEAFDAFLNGGGLAGFAAGPVPAVGVAEFGGVWIILFAPIDFADGSPDAEQPFSIARVGLGRDEIFHAGTRAAELWGGAGRDRLIGSEYGDVLDGGEGDDALVGLGGDDLLEGLAGRDLLNGGAGADRMTGGAGDDVYWVDHAGDTIVELASEGMDEVRTTLATYSLFGTGVENLTATSALAHDFRGNSGGNVITGGGGNDLLRLNDGGNDTALGGDGHDVFLFGATLTAADIVDGGAGRDQLAIQGNYALTLGSGIVGVESIAILPGSDTRFGDPGTNFYDYNLTTLDVNVAAGVQMIVDASGLRVGEDFTFNGSAETNGSFFIYGGRGVDTLTGGSGNDAFYFGEGLQFGAGDVVNGGPGGIDQLGLRGSYTVVFGAGQLVGIENIGLVSAQDTRFGPLGVINNYDLTMNDGNVSAGLQLTLDAFALRAGETLTFNGSVETNGTYRIFGGQGHDSIVGGQGNDTLAGNRGADGLTGGGGADTFRYNSTADSSPDARDHIHDFAPGIDKIDLIRIDANTHAAGDQAFHWIGANAFGGSGAGSAGELRAYLDNGNWFIEGDTDGNGIADLRISLTAPATPIGQGDFLL